MRIAVIGAAVGGLAAAERCRRFAEVDVYERKRTIGRPVNCGEGITRPELVPLAKTVENGFLNRTPGFHTHVEPAQEFGGSGDHLVTATIRCPDSTYICDRATVERAWADRLRSRGVTVRTGHAVSRDAFHTLTEEYDAVVDASGQPSLASKALGFAGQYGGSILALNADVEGDFSDYYPYAHVVFEGYNGYFWVFPKTPTRANVGIGWMDGEWPRDYRAAFEAACKRNGVPVPPEINGYTIPMGPSLDFDFIARSERGVYLVGDAAGIANRYQGEGIVQAIESAYLLSDLLEAGRPERYPDALAERMAPEFRLARLMTRALDACIRRNEFGLLADVARALDGLTPHQMTREPRTVYARLARRPSILYRLLRLATPKRALELAYETYRSDEVARAE